MAIKFFNVRTGEKRIAKTNDLISNAHIAAFYNSSNLSPNANEGQDFGWRLAPEVIVEMKRIKNSPKLIEHIAVRYNLPIDSVKDTNILAYISDQNERKPAAEEEGDFTEEYQDEIRKLENKNKAPKDEPEQSEESEEPEEEAKKAPTFKTVEGFSFDGHSYSYEESEDGEDVRYLKDGEEISGEDYAAPKEASSKPEEKPEEGVQEDPNEEISTPENPLEKDEPEQSEEQSTEDSADKSS